MKDRRFILSSLALVTILAGGLTACVRAGSKTPSTSQSESGVRVVQLEVSENTLSATLTEGEAQVTFQAERGAPIDYEANGWKRDPDIDPPGDSRWLLTDRKGQLISIQGDSLQKPGSWQALLNATPTRTDEELKADLAVAVAGADVLAREERVQRWFRWEVRLVRGAAKDLLEGKAPTQHENTPN